MQSYTKTFILGKDVSSDYSTVSPEIWFWFCCSLNWGRWEIFLKRNGLIMEKCVDLTPLSLGGILRYREVFLSY